jgi:hypothetical protein
MMRCQLGLLIGVVCCCLSTLGCSHTRDVSGQEPYPKWIGTADCLTCDCELWKEGELFPSYQILTPVGVYNREYAKLPKGTLVKVEAVKRESGNLLIASPESRHYAYDYAVVSLNDPKSPDRRIQATVMFAYLEILGRAKKPAEAKP